MTNVAATPTSKRVIRRMGRRPTAFLALQREARASVAPLLDAAGHVARIYVVGRRPGTGLGGGTEGARRWASLDDRIPHDPGWGMDPRGHYFEGEHPVFRFVHHDGRHVEIRRAATFFGEGRYSARQAAQAWELVNDELARSFPAGQLLSSPAATGRELWLQTISKDHPWPTLPDELQQLIRSTAGQGRIELLPRAPHTIPQLTVYDGRFMYAALCWGLPGRGARLERVSEYLGQTRARYHAQAEVPRDWAERCRCGAPGHAGIGLLPAPGDPGWRYPAEPGETFEGWWDGAELHVAIDHGWRIRPVEAIIFERAATGPLDRWARELIGVRARIDRRRLDDTVTGQLASAAVRSILLHAIGAFHGAGRRVTRSLPIEDASEAPADAADMRVEDGRLVWCEYQQAGWPALSHPEWSAAVWARARARLLAGPGPKRPPSAVWPYNRSRVGALYAQPSTVLAFRTDAIYLTHDPGWDDDGQPGRFRLTRQLRGPLATPRSHAQLLRAVR